MCWRLFQFFNLNDKTTFGDQFVSAKSSRIFCHNVKYYYTTNISLLNVIYNLASACISEWLKGVLHILISEDQTGFMYNRYIGDKIRILYDILYYTQSQYIRGVFLRVDFEKAFDSISWSFIHKTISFFGLWGHIIRWIAVFVYKYITSSVLVNGNVSSSFHIQRWWRQGDPLSPYIFLLCVEILAGLIRKN